MPNLTLLNQFGRPIPRIKPFKEMGTAGTVSFSGYIYTNEQSSDWTGKQKWITSSEMVSNISIIAASVHHFLNLIAHPQWTVKPKDEDDRLSVELAEFTDDVLHAMHTRWSRVVRRFGNFRFYGFGIHEWIASKRADGRIGFADIEVRPQHTIERWELTDTGVVEGIWQRVPMRSEILGIPRSKLIYLVEDTLTDSPEGLGIFRQLGEPYNRLKQLLALETRTFERDMRGIPIARAPLTQINRMVTAGQLTQEQANSMLAAVEDFVQAQVKDDNTGAVLDSQVFESQAADGLKVSGAQQWSIELLQGSANGLSELSSVIDRIQREIARVMGTEQLMMGDTGGNRALATDKSRNLYLVANSVLGDIVEAVEHDVIDTLWWLNGFPEDKKPTLGVEDVAFKDVAEVTVALKEMAAAGAVLSPDDEVINDVRELLGVSRVEPRQQLNGAIFDDPDEMEQIRQLEEPSVDDDGIESVI